MSLEYVLSLIVLLQSVRGGRHEDFISNDWTYIGIVNRACSSELVCNSGVPSCDSSTNGKTVQDRIHHNNCIAQGCEGGTQQVANTYHCASSRKEEFLSKGWSYIGNVNRACSHELVCGGAIPDCDSSTNGKTVQDRNSHNNCVAQGCEAGTQMVQLTYYCQTPNPTNRPSKQPSINPTTHPTTAPNRCGSLDIDEYLTGCSTTIETMSTAITTNKAEFDSFKVEVNAALDEISRLNSAHAASGINSDDFNEYNYVSVSFKDSVVFALLFLNWIAVIYVICALKAQNKQLKGGYSISYNQDIIENALDAQPLEI